ncbi:hypothetical protein K501DRAFT_285929 [Backusella circina FSU 941]|nr:hypothetical protein K501DRAFT_285929 [Backusella circina FSU 941]
MSDAIRKYESPDQQKFKDFYISINKKDEQKRVIQALQQHKIAKRSWQAGLVGILGVFASQEHHNIGLLITELAVWSFGVGFVWYKWLKREYEHNLQETCHAMASELNQVIQQTKSCAWVMEGNGDIMGTVALKFDHDKEGRIGYLTGLNSRIRLLLVQKAIRFAKENQIEVISKWDGNSRFAESVL